jgi:hypothetical protein
MKEALSKESPGSFLVYLQLYAKTISERDLAPVDSETKRSINGVHVLVSERWEQTTFLPSIFLRPFWLRETGLWGVCVFGRLRKVRLFVEL